MLAFELGLGKLLVEKLSGKNVINQHEIFGLSWIGKKNSVLAAKSKTVKILAEDFEEGLNQNKTQNVFIEGDNLDGLKLLTEKYASKIKLIYIDPPYNTGQDFIYRDKLKHSDWCSMIYPRLMIAKNLLADNGVIFISIDDNELFNLKLICDEIFGEENFVNCIAVKMSEATGVKMSHQMKRFPKLKEYLLFYKKDKFDGFNCIDKYKHGVWDKENNIYLENMTQTVRQELISFKEKNSLSESDIKYINKLIKNVKKTALKDKIRELNISNEDLNDWLFENSYRIVKTVGAKSLYKVVRNLPEIPNQEICAGLSKDKVLFFYITDFNNKVTDPRLRVIFADENIYKNPCDFWQDIKTSGSVALEGGIKYLNGKKPLRMLTRIIKMTTSDEDIILDFFAGSGSTGHAVMMQNAVDNQKRKFILIQNTENLDENIKNVKDETKNNIKEIIKVLDSVNKEHNIAEVAKERLRRSATQVCEINKNTDVGFKVYKITDKHGKDNKK